MPEQTEIVTSEKGVIAAEHWQGVKTLLGEKKCY